jgi:hypothetical protein
MQKKPTTVAHAVETAPSGATIVFRGGEYRKVDAIPVRQRLTLQPYPGEIAWIKGSDIVTGWKKESPASGPIRYHALVCVVGQKIHPQSRQVH